MSEDVERNTKQEDLQIIEHLLALALEAIQKKTPDVKLADVLKLLEFKQELKPQVDAQKIFWQWIDRLRREVAASGGDVPQDTAVGEPAPRSEEN